MQSWNRATDSFSGNYKFLVSGLLGIIGVVSSSGLGSRLYALLWFIFSDVHFVLWLMSDSTEAAFPFLFFGAITWVAAVAIRAALDPEFLNAFETKDSGITFIDNEGSTTDLDPRYVSLSDSESSFETASCGICGDAMTGLLVQCIDCETPHHFDCWDYFGRCSVYGCSSPGSRAEQ